MVIYGKVDVDHDHIDDKFYLFSCILFISPNYMLNLLKASNIKKEKILNISNNNNIDNGQFVNKYFQLMRLSHKNQ